MAFKVNAATWLKTEGDRVQSIILSPRHWGVKWTHPKLRKALADIGLEYSVDEINLLNDEMHTRGLVEDVPD
jgi:hypothetical protein